MTSARGTRLRWCQACRRRTRHRQVQGLYICLACERRDAVARGSSSRPGSGSPAGPTFDWKERQAGAHLEDREP